MKKNKGKKFIKIILILIALLMVPVFSTINDDLFNSVLKGDINGIRASLAGNLSYGYMLTLLLMIIQNSFTIIPLILVITINITLFGFIKGFFWSWVSGVLGAVIIYIGVRYIFQDRLIKKFKPDVIEKVEQKGFIYIFQARVFPFVPTSLVNILAGLSSIRFIDFLLGTIIGNFIYFFILSLIPLGLFSVKINEYVLGTIILLLIILFYGFKKFYKRKGKHPFINMRKKDHSQDWL